ncbi:MAG: hypothetical protein ChlgKO_00460 [Chlamydiales bacterium]
MIEEVDGEGDLDCEGLYCEGETSPITVFFCNGIGTSFESAQAKAGLIEEAFAGRVICVHNPTEITSMVVSSLFPKIWGVGHIHEMHDATETRIIQELADRIFSEVQSGKEVVLIGHSHGVFLLDRAIKDPRFDNFRQLISFYAFAGAKAVKNKQAAFVQNYICGSGFVSRMANWYYHKKETYLILQELRKGKSCEEAACSVLKMIGKSGDDYERLLNIAKKYNIYVIPSRADFWRDHFLRTFVKEIQEIANSHLGYVPQPVT